MSTTDDVEAALVECHDLWRRSPGAGGGGGYARDLPAFLMCRLRELGDYGGEGQDGVSDGRPPRAPLDAAEVARRDRVTAWLELLPEPRDRDIVWLATQRLHAGAARVPWASLARRIAIEVTARRIEQRYRAALWLLLARLTGKGAAWAKRMSARRGLVDDPRPGRREIVFDGEVYVVPNTPHGPER